MNGPLSPERLSANTTLKREPRARRSSTSSMASGGLLLGTSPAFRRDSGLKMRQEQREGGGPQHPGGVDRDDAVGQRVQIADVLGGDGVGRVPLLAVTRLVDAPDEGRLADRLAPQVEPLGSHLLHRPLRVGQDVMGGLRVYVDDLAEAWQGLASRLGQQPQVQRGELLEVPHMVEQVAIPGAILVDEAHRRRRRARLAHAEPPSDGVGQQTACLR